MTIANRGPLGQKPAKAKPNPAYLAEVRRLTCCICDAHGLPQSSPTQAHHAIMGRGSVLRTPDDMAIPLCEGHHQGFFDTTQIAIHREPARWRKMYGPDTDWIAGTRDRVANALGDDDLPIGPV